MKPGPFKDLPGWAGRTHFSTAHGGKVHVVTQFSGQKPTPRSRELVYYVFSPCGQHSVARFAPNPKGPTTCAHCKRYERRQRRSA